MSLHIEYHEFEHEKFIVSYCFGEVPYRKVGVAVSELLGRLIPK